MEGHHDQHVDEDNRKDQTTDKADVRVPHRPNLPAKCDVATTW